METKFDNKLGRLKAQFYTLPSGIKEEDFHRLKSFIGDNTTKLNKIFLIKSSSALSPGGLTLNSPGCSTVPEGIEKPRTSDILLRKPGGPTPCRSLSIIF